MYYEYLYILVFIDLSKCFRCFLFSITLVKFADVIPIGIARIRTPKTAQMPANILPYNVMG